MKSPMSTAIWCQLRLLHLAKSQASMNEQPDAATRDRGVHERVKLLGSPNGYHGVIR